MVRAQSVDIRSEYTMWTQVEETKCGRKVWIYSIVWTKIVDTQCEHKVWIHNTLWTKSMDTQCEHKVWIYSVLIHRVDTRFVYIEWTQSVDRRCGYTV